MADELPKQELLAKLLKMTSSSNDGEALTAMRKANSLLASAGWDWDRLLAGKITVVGDPFATLQTPEVHKPSSAPKAPRRASAPPPPPPPPTAAQMRMAQDAADHAKRASAAAQAAARAKIKKPYSTKPNIYPGGCYCCGLTVEVGKGFVFHPKQENSLVKQDIWAPICTSCNTSRAFVPVVKTKRVFPPEPDLRNVNPDLSNL